MVAVVEADADDLARAGNGREQIHLAEGHDPSSIGQLRYVRARHQSTRALVAGAIRVHPIQWTVRAGKAGARVMEVED